MVLGYDEERPAEKDYYSFLDKLVKGLEGLGKEGLSLMIYGSFVRGDYIPGGSDIDGIIIFPHEIVIDKEFMNETANVFNRALSNGNSLMRPCIQLSPLDIRTIKDGRFNSFGDDFEAYFDLEGRVVVGPDYRPQMNYIHLKTGEQSTLSHNLRKMRSYMLFSRYDQENDYKNFLRGFRISLYVASRGSKQILYLADGKLRLNRFSALEELQTVFPSVNPGPLKEIKHLFTHLNKLDQLYKNPEKVLRVWNSSATFFEEVLREYIKMFPNPEKEVQPQ